MLASQLPQNEVIRNRTTLFEIDVVMCAKYECLIRNRFTVVIAKCRGLTFSGHTICSMLIAHCTEPIDSTDEADDAAESSTSAQNTEMSSVDGGPSLQSVQVAHPSTDVEADNSPHPQVPNEATDDTTAKKHKKISK